MRSGRIVLILAVLLAGATLAGLLLLPDKPPQLVAPTGQPPPAMPAGLMLPEKQPAGAVRAADPDYVFSEQDGELLAGLRQRFAPHIHIQHAQIKLLEQLISYLRQQYPANWRDRVASFVQALFPEQAEALLTKFEGLLSFNAWLETNRERLRSINAADRSAALWAARYAAFGEDANEIWAVELKNRQIHETLSMLDQRPDLSVDEKLTLYLQSIEAAYGDDAADFMHSRQTELTSRFLAVDSVQEQLHGLPDEQRNVRLREVRQAMGMSPPAVERWSALDRKRDASWANGQTYMQQRSRIMQAYEGEERQAELQRLQQSHFGEQADVIRAEEQAGFYRYAHERRIGRE